MALFFSERIRAMRKYLAFGRGRVGKAKPIGLRLPAEIQRFRQAKRVRIPSVGSGLATASSFNAAGVGSFRLATDGTGV